LMNVEPNILFTVHKGAPFRRCAVTIATYSNRGALL
jgi:hypothetical protein